MNISYWIICGASVVMVCVAIYVATKTNSAVERRMSIAVITLLSAVILSKINNQVVNIIVSGLGILSFFITVYTICKGLKVGGKISKKLQWMRDEIKYGRDYRRGNRERRRDERRQYMEERRRKESLRTPIIIAGTFDDNTEDTQPTAPDNNENKD